MLKVMSSENFSLQSYQKKKSIVHKGLIPWTKMQIQLMSDVLLEPPQKPREKDYLYLESLETWLINFLFFWNQVHPALHMHNE